MLALTALSKTYGRTVAVRDVTLEAAPGQVLGLAGENGAGKSTLIKMVAGAVAPDAGGITLGGKVLAPRSTLDAMKLGIASVFQELTLIRSLSVERNLCIAAPPLTPWRGIDRRALRRAATETLARHGLSIDPGAAVGDLTLGEQQMLEIVRAVERNPQVLLLDEATSALGAAEVKWLDRLVGRLRAAGKIVLFISHRWDEVVRFCDRVAVMRNGELAGVADRHALSEDEAIRLMTGHAATAARLEASWQPGEAIVLQAEALRSAVLRDVSLSVRQGEILGLAGLVGQGQGHLVEALFGAHALEAGSIVLKGARLPRLTPKRAIAAGLAYVPQERKTEGLLLAKSVGTNMTLAILDKLRAILGLIDPVREAALVARGVASLKIRTAGAHEPVRNLSGGNQQKVLLERWLLTNPTILLLNDVTRGVDVGTKRQIYALIQSISRTGVAVLWYSTDARELVEVVHRVVVMLQGRVSAELGGTTMTVDRIIRASILEAVPDPRDADAPRNL